MPATGCGMTSGRSISAETTARPRNERRARRYASGVAPTIPSSVAMVAVTAVSSSDARRSSVARQTRHAARAAGRHESHNRAEHEQQKQRRRDGDDNGRDGADSGIWPARLDRFEFANVELRHGPRRERRFRRRRDDRACRRAPLGVPRSFAATSGSRESALPRRRAAHRSAPSDRREWAGL